MAAKKTAKKTAKTANKAKKAKKAKTAKKAAKKTAKKTAAPKAAAKESSKPASKAKPAAKKKAAAKNTVSSMTVNMAHVFALRPRAVTSFKAGDFSTAKHQLQDEAYSDIHAAAKAVVEKALELTHGAPKKGRKGHF